MKLSTLLKLGVSIVMLYIVLRTARFDHLASTLASIPLSLLALIVALYIVGQVLSSFKWWLIARAGGIDVPYASAIRVYFIGMFVNCFGLGTVGGDVARGVLLTQGLSMKAEGLASVIADRLHGLAVLASIGLVATLIFGRQTLEPFFVYALIFMAASIVIGWFIGPELATKILPETSKIRKKVERVAQLFPRKSSVIIKISAVSLMFHLLQISLHSLMALALGVHVAWTFLLVAIPFVNIVSTLPISWNGLGVRENAYAFFLVPAILRPEQAVAFGAMWLLSVTVASAIGGIVAVVTKDFETLEQLDAEGMPVATQAPKNS